MQSRRTQLSAGSLIAVVLALVLAACGSSTSSSSSGDKKPADLDIGVMAYDIGLDASVTTMMDTIRGEAKKQGVKVDIRNGGNDLNKQISQVQDFITAGKDAIIVYPGDPEGIGPAVRQAEKAGIPVFSVNLQLSDSIPVTAYVGADDTEYGREQARMLIEDMGETGQVGLIMGALGTSAQIQRTEGFEDEIKKYPGIEVVEKQADGWQADKTIALAQDWVAKHPKDDLDAIVVQGPQAMGAVTWADKNGRSNLKWVLGDYPTDLVAPIKDGRIVGTINQDFKQQGSEVLEAAVTYLTGDKSSIKKKMFTPLPRITKENVDQVEPSFGL